MLIKKEAWEFLKSWYGCELEFKRQLIKIEGCKHCVDLYPPLITAMVAGENGLPVRQRSITILTNSCLKMKDLKKEMIEKLVPNSQQNIATNTRLWFYYNDVKKWTVITEEEKTVEDYNLMSGDRVLLELEVNGINFAL